MTPPALEIVKWLHTSSSLSRPVGFVAVGSNTSDVICGSQLSAQQEKVQPELAGIIPDIAVRSGNLEYIQSVISNPKGSEITRIRPPGVLGAKFPQQHCEYNELTVSAAKAYRVS